eukprot:12933255-Prorocentrum_lima.AAC.1
MTQERRQELARRQPVPEWKDLARKKRCRSRDRRVKQARKTSTHKQKRRKARMLKKKLDGR